MAAFQERVSVRPALRALSPLLAQQRARARAYSMLLGAQLAISSGGIMARFALAGMSVPMAGAWRFSMVAVVLLARLIIKRRPLLPWRHELALAAAGLLLAEQFATWMLSISYLTVGTATVLYCTAPFWNGLYEALILRKQPPRAFWCALSIAAVGVCMMVYEGPSTHEQTPTHLRMLGIALALASGLGVASFLIVMRHLSKFDPRGDNHNTVDMSTRVYVSAALALTFMCYFDGHPLPPLSEWTVWAGVISMAVVTQGIGHTLQNASLRHIPASMVGFATLLEPLIATGLAWLIFDEALSVRGGVGALLVLGALAWALMPARRPKSQGP